MGLGWFFLGFLSRKKEKGEKAVPDPRADAVKAGRVKKGDGKVVDHKTPLRKGGSNKPSNTRVTTRKKNAGWRKGKSGYD